MKFKFTFLLAITLGTLNNLYSQTENSRLNFFLSVGVNNSTIKNEYKLVSSWWCYSNEKGEKSKQRLNSGIGIEYRLSKHFSIESGIQFSFPKSIITIHDYDTLVANWKQIPRSVDVNTEYKILSIPIDIKYSFFNNTKIRIYLKYGIQTNSITGYKCVATETYYDGEILNYNTSYQKDKFSKFNFSMVGSIGFDYNILERFYIGVDSYYSYMFDSVEGDKTIWEHHYTINVNDLGIKIIMGYRF